MKFGTGSKAELTQMYSRVKVQNDTHMSTHIYKLVVCLSTNIERACLVGPARLCSKFLEFYLFQKICFYSKRIAYYSINFLIILLLLQLEISEIVMTAVYIAKVCTI